MPRKMSGSAISMMEELTVAISMPSVVLDSAIHLYRDPAPAASLVRGLSATDGTGISSVEVGLTWRDRRISCYMTTKLCRSLFPPARLPRRRAGDKAWDAAFVLLEHAGCPGESHPAPPTERSAPGAQRCPWCRRVL